LSSSSVLERNTSSSGVGGRLPPLVHRYSTAFKLHVVSEIESGRLSMEGARRRYGIGGKTTVTKWLRRFGKNHLLPKVVRVETPEERDQVTTLKQRVRELESSLADAHIKLMAYESLVEVAEKEYKLDLKKNFGTEQLRRSQGFDPLAGNVSGKDH